MRRDETTCASPRRRAAVRERGRNGLDAIEVSDDQRTLTVTFLGKAPADLAPGNVVIRGRGPAVAVTGLRLCTVDDPDLDDCLHVTVDRPGGFAAYELCLVEADERGTPTDRPFHGFDPRYACLAFSFKVGCPSDLDCKAAAPCPPASLPEPAISYLAKDYASFRRLILDRLALTLPAWRERHAPDLGITLVEVLAYVGDHLSYHQDAVATEAYLATARQRISVRRHARLVDYPMHDGANARAWVVVETDDDLDLEPGQVAFVTGFPGAPADGTPLGPGDLDVVPAGWYETFEPLLPAGALRLRAAHTLIQLYAWGDAECCLPRGATRATLKDEWLPAPPAPEPPGSGYGYGYEKQQPPPPPRERRLDLAPGDFLFLEEVVGPRTGHPGDADPTHRHVVRLTRVERSVDELFDQPVVDIEWAPEDALPFPLCLSAVGPPPDCALLTGVGVARGNVLLADHGRRLGPEALGSVPAGEAPARCAAEGRLEEEMEPAGAFRPELAGVPLTWSAPLPADPAAPAARLLAQDPRRALPALQVASDAGTPHEAAWQPRRDLLASGPGDAHLAVEIDGEGRAHLRFGDGEMGLAPAAGSAFTAVYRVGNGPAGNVAAGAISHVVFRDAKRTGVTLRPRNPLSARGGTAPETLAEVRLLAPGWARAGLERAVAPEDYARLVEREFAGRVQRAAATLVWNGSWHEVAVAVDPVGGVLEEGLRREIEAALARYRRIGHAVVVGAAIAVPLDVALEVCVLPGHQRGHVKAALLDALGSRELPGGRRGFFHPDDLTFGHGISLSRLVAAAAAVPGVESVHVTRLERLGEGPSNELERGFLPLAPMEVAILTNAASAPEEGRLTLTLRGGR